MDDINSRFRRPSTRYGSPGFGPSTTPSRPLSSNSPARPAQMPKPNNSFSNSDSQYNHPMPPEKSRSNLWIFVTLLIIILLGIGGAGVAWYLKNNSDDKSEKSQGKPAPATSEQEQVPAGSLADNGIIRLVATGDMIAHDSINKNALKTGGGYDYAALMSDIKPFFNKADIGFCNQSVPAGGASFGITGYPSFNAPIEFARGIEDVGCNLINIGSNHTNDKGQPLVDATVAAWDKREKILAVAGANRNPEEQNKLRVFEIKGMKFAFVSYTTYTNKPLPNAFGVNMYSDALAKKQITEARKAADFVIVSMRWGTEYSPNVNAKQDEIAQKVANFGGDVILGHGPHVLQPVKKLKATDKREVLVWYSLGNFLNSQLEIESLIGGFAIMDIEASTKKIKNIAFMPVYQHYEWTAEQKKRASATDLAARKNFKMVPLDTAAGLLAKSQHNTTVKAQAERIKALLNKFNEVTIIESSTY